MGEREDRAAQRRADWSSAVVEAGAPKGRLYAHLHPAQRLAAMTRLNALVWQAATGEEIEPLPRAQWPGEIFEIRRG